MKVIIKALQSTFQQRWVHSSQCPASLNIPNVNVGSQEQRLSHLLRVGLGEAPLDLRSEWPVSMAEGQEYSR